MRRPPIPPIPVCGCVVEPGHCAEELAHVSCLGFMAGCGLVAGGPYARVGVPVSEVLGSAKEWSFGIMTASNSGVGAGLTDWAEAEPARFQSLPSVVQSVRQFGRRVDFGCGYGGIWLLWADASIFPPLA
jgi:hypothetical protein